MRIESRIDRASVAAVRRAKPVTFGSVAAPISRIANASRWRDTMACNDVRQRSTASALAGAPTASQTSTLRD